MRTTFGLVLLFVAAACQKGKSKLDENPPAKVAGVDQVTAHIGSGSAAPAAPAEDLDSKDILGRSETSPNVYVKHVLIGWKDVGRDERAKSRSNAEAAALARDVAGKLRANPDSIDELVTKYSEDPGSLRGDPYNVKPETQFVPEFKNLALRLKEKEVGIVKTQFGYHVMLRVPEPPPDPLQSNDVLARAAEPGPVYIHHLLIGWDKVSAHGPPGSPAATRSKADADKLAKSVLDRSGKGEDFAKLIKELSDEPGAKDKPQPPVEIKASTQIIEELKNLAMRLKLNEVGMVKTSFGWLVLQRVAPPPPDSLESADILKREPVTKKAKVKHILLGWTETHAEDPRGVKRTRAELEKLVKETVAKLKKGDKIEPLMTSLSEDPGSAKTGNSYDVTPEAGLVPPFKNLSLRLNLNEVGVVKTDFGIHIIQRVE